jgi:hypothetical protein
MMGKLRNPHYYCEECDVAFDIISWPKADTRKKYCPMCGDYVGVKALRPKHKADGKLPWTYEEEQWLDEYIAGNLSFYILVHKTGRGITAVRSRIGRRKQELKIQSKRPAWSDEDKATAERCWNKEITIQELADLTGKTFTAARMHMHRMKKKRSKENENHIERTN